MQWAASPGSEGGLTVVNSTMPNHAWWCFRGKKKENVKPHHFLGSHRIDEEPTLWWMAHCGCCTESPVPLGNPICILISTKPSLTTNVFLPTRPEEAPKRLPVIAVQEIIIRSHHCPGLCDWILFKEGKGNGVLSVQSALHGKANYIAKICAINRLNISEGFLVCNRRSKDS
jgi:hypothetical protein